MKLLLLTVTFFLLLGAAWSQSLSEGSVVGLQIEPNPLNGTFVYDFEICCGYPAGSGGFLGNGFAYVESQFSLFYKYPGQVNGFSFSGTIDTWDTAQAISKNCTVQSGTLNNAQITQGTKVVATGMVAEYSQLFCQRDGVYWIGPGGLSVHAQ
ncbi:MAG TPA: hypothetical protein VJW96_11625 [Terriglobales bacterium]|jgi:hypothetical protein|nr:hypothetical protein [Terriglobales bacterium]